MGAFDSYRADASCPRCGRIHDVEGQFYVFDPDFGALHCRDFVPRRCEPVLATPSDYARRILDHRVDYMRVSDPPTDPRRIERITMQGDPNQDFDVGCDCGATLHRRLHFRLRESSAELEKITLIDITRDDIAAGVDYVDGEHLPRWPAGASFAERSAIVRARYEGLPDEWWHDPSWSDRASPRKVLVCPSCADARESFYGLRLSEEDVKRFFGAAPLRPRARARARTRG